MLSAERLIFGDFFDSIFMKLSFWNLITLIFGVGALAASGAFSDDSGSGKKKEKKDGAGDWCDTLQDIGKVYDEKKKKNPYIQEIQIFGRYHQQWIYSDGSDRGRDFSGYGQQLRRFRVGASMRFFDRWELQGRINLENSEFNNTRLRHDNFDNLIITYESKDIGPLDEPMFGYGLTKIDFGGEWYLSSRSIKTVERSNLSNIYSPSRATGFFGGAQLETPIKNFDILWGVFSTRERNYSWAAWDGGRAYFGSMRTKLWGGKIRGDVIYVDATKDDDEVFGFDWATSLTYDFDWGPWEIFLNSTYGREEDGDIYGFVFLPSTYLIEDRLELVFRYQWAHSTELQLRPGSRNNMSPRSVALADGVIVAQGDDNHSFYGGLNYYFCEDNLKLMFGLEYETLTGGITDFEATTLWGALRFFF